MKQIDNQLLNCDAESQETTESPHNYSANIRSLCEKLPHFAHEIDSVGEKWLIPCDRSRSGEWTCQVPGPNHKSVFTHSRYEPVREARRWADGAVSLAEQQEDADTGKVPMCYVIDGFGLGYHVQELFDQLSGDAFIVVSEPNLPLLRTALEKRDYSEMLESERLIFITKADRTEIFRKLESHATAMMMGVVFTHALQSREEGFHAKVHTLISEYTAFVRANLWTLLGCSMQTCKNVIHNLPVYVSTPSTEAHKNRFCGKPAVLVAAGPSLRKNIETLKQCRDRVIVIAVQTVLKPLLAAGIEPDFVTSLDFSHVCKRFFEDVPRLQNTHLVAEPKAHWDVIDIYRDIGPMTLLGNDFASLLLGELEDNHDRLKGGTTVAHLSFYLAEYLGADPIILIGQDLGFTDNVYYAPGNALHDLWEPELNRFNTIENKEWERILRQGKSLRRVKDHFGGPIYTDEEMFTYLQQFEKDFANCKVRVIDASEGGAKKQFCETMSLGEAVEQYATGPLDKNLFSYRNSCEWFQNERLLSALEQLKRRVEEAEEFKEIVIETISLVKSMLDLLDDQPELNRKMVRLDELRSRVTQRVDIYKMIGNVSQMAELFRFRQDRIIGLKEKQGKERQRQQLLRDIGYVGELNNGCDRLIELLREGIVRFEAELEKQGISYGEEDQPEAVSKKMLSIV
jgi:hypothetical protein